MVLEGKRARGRKFRRTFGAHSLLFSEPPWGHTKQLGFRPLCKQAGTLRSAATPKGQITEEIPLQSPRAIYDERKSARLTLFCLI